MQFRAKLRRIGNSVGVILPRHVITGLGVGDEIVITIGDVITDEKGNVITPEQGLTVDNAYAVGAGSAILDKCQYCGQPTDQPSPQCYRHGQTAPTP